MNRLKAAGALTEAPFFAARRGKGGFDVQFCSAFGVMLRDMALLKFLPAISVVVGVLFSAVMTAPIGVASSSDGVLSPGTTVSMWGSTSRVVCTAGFLARNRRGTEVLLEAGHCDHGGELTMSAGRAGGQVPVGGFVVSEPGGDNTDAADIGVVRLEKNVPVQPSIAGTIPVRGSLSYLAPGQTLCKVGAVTGRSCGPVVESSASKVRFSAAVAPGDSGGPVYAMRSDGSAVAVGITISHALDDGDVIAELIDPWLQRWDLTVD